MNDDKDTREQWDSFRCVTCIHWISSRCGYGFTEPLVEGITYAKFCDFYTPPRT